MQLETMSGALRTGEILAAGGEEIHSVVVGKLKFIFSKQLPMANVAILSEMQCRSQRLQTRRSNGFDSSPVQGVS